MVNSYLVLALTALFLIILDRLMSFAQHHGISSTGADNCVYGPNNKVLYCEPKGGIPDIISIVGGPGSGKGTQAQELSRVFGFRHIALGDLIRQQAKKKGKLSDEINKYMKQGKLIPSQKAVELILNQLKKYKSSETVLLDGFPRSQQNLKVWSMMTGGNQKFRIKKFINFECPETVLQQRLLQRAKVSGRADDNAQTIKERIQRFILQTKSVINQINDDEWNKVISVDSNRSVLEVADDLKRKLIAVGYKLLH